MNWKIFTSACISLSASLFPNNIIGCGGGDADPFDYYVSFFDKNLDNDPSSKPFYYTNYEFLYDSEEPVNLSQLTSEEWIGYTAKKISKKDAYDFVCAYPLKDLNSIYFNIEKNQPLAIPDSVKDNGMSMYFQESRDLEALGYLIYAKKLEPHVTGSWSSWEPVQRDSLTMAKLIRNGQQLYAASKNPFIKLRYAYQVTRLAHYSNRFKDCINFYDQMIASSDQQSIIPDLSLSLKAGAMMKLGKKNEAAYEFSKLFSKNSYRRVSNYMSFDWCVKRFDEDNRNACLALCKNNSEKANLLGLFVLGSNQDELPALQKIYSLDPASSLLPLLTIREMHKIEEYFFSPSLSFTAGDTSAMRGYNEVNPKDADFLKFKTETGNFIELCSKISNDKRVKNRELFTVLAAHAAMIAKDYKRATSILSGVKKNSLNTALSDQVQMTNMLLTINSKDSIDQLFEEQLLPSVKWLADKAKTNDEYEKFYRRLFADVLVSKYRPMKGKDHIKYLLCLGVADRIFSESKGQSWGYYPTSVSMLRNKSTAIEIEQLIALTESNGLNKFEKFLVSTSAFTKDDLNDIAGTARMRQFQFDAAQKWFEKIPVSYYEKEPFITYLAANPFADLILDTHAPTEADTVIYTKLKFAKKMVALQNLADKATDGRIKAKYLYQMANGFYHMSYWGNSWMLVKYDWSSGYYEPRQNLLPADEYYSVETAERYYMKAYNVSPDNNLKARAIFMAAKCDQKEMGNIPGAYSYLNTNDNYGAELKTWLTKFDKRNKYFSTLIKDYKATEFFKEAQRSCSFLDDFIKTVKK